MIQTKVPDEDKIRAVLKVKEFPGFVTGKVTKNGFPLEASWVGHPVSRQFWTILFHVCVIEKRTYRLFLRPAFSFTLSSLLSVLFY